MSPEVRRFEQIEPKSLQQQVKEALEKEEFISLKMNGGKVYAGECEGSAWLISVRDANGNSLVKTGEDCDGLHLAEWTIRGLYGTSSNKDLHAHPNLKEGTPCKQFSTKRGTTRKRARELSTRIIKEGKWVTKK